MKNGETQNHPDVNGHLHSYPTPTVKVRIPVYQDGTEERLSITRAVNELPEQQKRRSGEPILSKFERLFHSIYDPAVMTDVGGNILEANARAEYNFTWSKEELLAMNVIDLISGADAELVKVINESVNADNYVTIEAVCVRADKSEFPAEIVVSIIRQEEGNLLSFFFRDVTARKKAEDELAKANERNLEAEKISSRLHTVSTLVYELNNPIQIILLKAERDRDNDLIQQTNRITSVLERLGTNKPLQVSVDESGITRYELPPSTKGGTCDYNRFLVVDDEVMLRQMFVEALSMAYSKVMIESAHDGRNAVELFAKRHHGLIIMDLCMPVLNGEEAYAEIIEICKNENLKPPTFLFCTGFIPSERIMTIIGDESVNSLIEKPFTTGNLIKAVEKRLSLISDVIM